MRSETEIELIGENKLLSEALRDAYEVIKTIVGESIEEGAMLHNAEVSGAGTASAGLTG